MSVFLIFVSTSTSQANASSVIYCKIKFRRDNLSFSNRAGRLSAPTMRSRSAQFLRLMSTRRSLRFFSQDPIPDQVLERCIQAAATSPSGVRVTVGALIFLASLRWRHDKMCALH